RSAPDARAPKTAEATTASVYRRSAPLLPAPRERVGESTSFIPSTKQLDFLRCAYMAERTWLRIHASRSEVEWRAQFATLSLILPNAAAIGAARGSEQGVLCVESSPVRIAVGGKSSFGCTS